MRESELAARIWVQPNGGFWAGTAGTAMERRGLHRVNCATVQITRFDCHAQRKRSGRYAGSRRQTWRPEGHANHLNPGLRMVRIRVSCAMRWARSSRETSSAPSRFTGPIKSGNEVSGPLRCRVTQTAWRSIQRDRRNPATVESLRQTFLPATPRSHRAGRTPRDRRGRGL